LTRFLIALLPAIVLLGCSAEILHDLPEPEANKAVAALQRSGIHGEKSLSDAEGNTWNVTVPTERVARAYAVLEEFKLPGGQELRSRDIFCGEKLVVTPTEERICALIGREGDVAANLESLNGVIDARVHLVLPEKDLTGQMRGTAKASVLIEYQQLAGGRAPLTEAEVQQLVAGAIDGLRPEAVIAIMKPSALPVAGGSSVLQEELLAVGGLMVDAGSKTRFQLYAAIAVILMFALVVMLVLGGKANHELRTQLAGLEDRLRAARRAASASTPVRRALPES
jgi:type III secretion protein J